MTKKNQMTVVKDDEPKTELIKRTPIEETPFHVIETDGKIFGAFGQYKITENQNSVEEVKEMLSLITWDRIVQISSIILEMLNNKKN
ncbi:MAG: hypothetical protein [Microviridae sp.]|nr:MAG: hypothetical protein [Microviridae sp.]